MSLYDYSAKDLLSDREIPMHEFRGKVLIVVNVACHCGLTKENYSQMRELEDKYYERGLRVLCFPCNQFAGQEPGTPAEISAFVRNYSDRFVVFDKVKVNGSDAHPIYKFLKSKLGGFLFDAIKWNFTKFLVDRNGVPVKRFGPKDAPSVLAPDIEKLLE